MPRSAPITAVLLAAGLVLAACGGRVIDAGKAEDAVERDFERNVGTKTNSVECPSDVDVKAGNSFDCVVETDRGAAIVTLKVLNEDADVRVTGLKRGG